MKIVSKSLAETKEFAEGILNKLNSENNQKTSQVVGLFGDLGAGKTAFVQTVAQILGVRETVNSPTFVIIKSYDIKESRYHWERLIHIDAYRLDDPEELAKLNFQELTDDPLNLILIEWPERVEKILPADFFRIHFKFIDQNTREIEFNA